MRQFSPEEILGRPSPPLELIGAEAEITGRRVLVTGAAGSVGAPLTHLLLGLRPTELVLIDHHEHTLFRLRQEIGHHPGTPIRWVLADVRDRRKLETVFRDCPPAVVFHLAAYKHVPLGEENPDQTVDVNLRGTRTLIEAAVNHGATSFVYPSSDKAVDPPSVYGSTKRICEALTLAANRAFPLRLSVVRFVNIVGTRGSVIETFAAQIAGGRPLTLTDPGMTRYWITMPEATRLLAQTVCARPGGAVFLPDVSTPVKLAEMAARLGELLAPGAPGGWPIQFIGPRPGERMHEVLLSSNESARPTPYPGILEVVTSRGDFPTYADLSERMDALLELAAAGEPGVLKRRALDLANSLQ